MYHSRHPVLEAPQAISVKLERCILAALSTGLEWMNILELAG